MTRRRVAWAVAGMGMVAFAIWAKLRIDGLSEETQATNPIVRWEWVFLREDTRGELWDATWQHLKLTFTAVGVGIV